MEFNLTMKEFCQMLKEKGGKIIGMNLRSDLASVVEDVENLPYYNDEKPIMEGWARQGNVFQIDDKYLVILRDDNTIRAILGMYEIKKWVQQDGVIAASGHDQVMIYDIQNMKMTLK